MCPEYTQQDRRTDGWMLPSALSPCFAKLHGQTDRGGLCTMTLSASCDPRAHIVTPHPLVTFERLFVHLFWLAAPLSFWKKTWCIIPKAVHNVANGAQMPLRRSRQTDCHIPTPVGLSVITSDICYTQVKSRVESTPAVELFQYIYDNTWGRVINAWPFKFRQMIWR